jgi:hypothetical protein
MVDKPSAHTGALSPEEIDRIATKRAGAKLGWFFHAAAFTGINLVVFAMSKYGFGDRSWSIIPFLGWAVGLALHGVSVWVLGAGGGLRERMVQKERERLLREQDGRNGP